MAVAPLLYDARLWSGGSLTVESETVCCTSAVGVAPLSMIGMATKTVLLPDTYLNTNDLVKPVRKVFDVSNCPCTSVKTF